MRHLFAGHVCKTAQHMGWTGKKNGELLRLAEAAFDVFVTSDQNIRYQQNLSGCRIAIVELSTNKLRRIRAAAEFNSRSDPKHSTGGFHSRQNSLSVNFSTRASGRTFQSKHRIGKNEPDVAMQVICVGTGAALDWRPMLCAKSLRRDAAAPLALIQAFSLAGSRRCPLHTFCAAF